MIYGKADSARLPVRKDFSVHDDVSVTRPRDGRGDRTPPAPRSRPRVLAVMGSMVVGCGVAAAAVILVPGDPARVVEADHASVEDDARVPRGGQGHTRLVTTGESTTTTTTGSDGAEDSSAGTTPPDPDADENKGDAREGGGEDGSGPGATRSDPPRTEDRPPSSTTAEPPPEPSEPPESSPPPPTTTPDDDEDDEDDGCWLFC